MEHSRKTLPLMAAAAALILSWTGQGALAACTGGPDVFTCLSETDFMTQAAALGYATFKEGFEDDTTWSTVRSTATVSNSAPSITSQGIVWTANHLQNEITTGIGARLTGLWGIYDPDHGFATGTTAECDVDLPPEHCLWYDGVTGTRVAGESPLYAVGGYVRTSTVGANITFILDDVLPFDFGKLTDTAHHFFGVIDRRGFNRFQVREVDGKIGQKFLIFADDFTFGFVPPAVWPAATPAAVNTSWTSIKAASGFLNPVVIAGPPTYHGGDPGVVRLRNVTSLGFDMRFQEWDYLDRIHTPAENVFYVVSESGQHSLGGLLVEAGRVNTSKIARKGQWVTVDLAGTFAQPPVLLSDVLTVNGGSAVTTRIQDLTPVSFSIAMDEQELLLDGHAVETLGWIAIEPGSAITSDKRKVQTFTTQVDSSWTTVPFATTLHRYPTVVGDVDSTFDLDPVFLRYRDPTSSQIGLRLAEEQSLDTETTHLLEDIGLFVAE